LNAYELADHMEKYFDSEPYCDEVVTMLRQQQAEIEALKAENSHLKYEISSGAWNPVPLTDEEIFKTALEQYGHSVGLYGNHIGFARAILRKAQEK
jgi:hypothetical protein